MSVAGAVGYRPPRPVFAVPAGFALLLGLWAGLSRAGWDIPSDVQWDARHGPLMISGFLGTLITMERAVGSGWRWSYAGPALAGAGAVVLVLVEPLEPARLLFTGSSLILVCLFALLLYRYRLLPMGVLLTGAAFWLAGNLFWLNGDSLPRVVPWWVAFLVVTITGERLELTAYTTRRRRARVLFLLALAPLLAGLLLTREDQQTGQQVAGAGMMALALWLFRFDIARRSIRRPEPARYIASSLLAGYAWLAAGGLIWLLGPEIKEGFVYDATLHAILLGFVISMVFGHALIILPGTLRLHVDFHRRFYAHLLLLHASVALRLYADFEPNFDLRRWAGLLNATAILVFLASTFAAARPRRTAPPAVPSLSDEPNAA
ncbi:MAG TPA: hypothetical protein VLS25_10515 [Dehalococcoidia bacterium]|nr:hypothetical protein [Dehalococcoidia bacterium]